MRLHKDYFGCKQCLVYVSEDIIEAMIKGERDPKELAQLAKGRLREKLLDIEEALSGFFEGTQAFMCRQIISHIDFLEKSFFN